MMFTWIAVALATAIFLFARSRAEARATVRIAAIVLIVVAAIDLGSLYRVRNVERDFKARATEHLQHDVADLRTDIRELEQELDASAARIATRIAKIPANDRARLFRVLAPEAAKAGRGARIIGKDSEPVAWFGEDYRAPGDRTYQFDVTNLYVTRSRPAAGLTVQAFARIENVPGRRVPLHSEDEWVT